MARRHVRTSCEPDCSRRSVLGVNEMMARDSPEAVTGRPFILVQISDPHIGGTWAGADSLDRLDSTMEALRRLPDEPDALLISGDLADHGAADEYEDILERIGQGNIPLCVLPGNHDDRETMRAVLGLDGAEGSPLHSSVDLGALRLILLDTTIPGETSGDVAHGAIAWLVRELGLAPELPTVLAMHHPPLLTGSPAWDRIGLPLSAHAALEWVLQLHPQVLGVFAGHVHRALVGELGGRIVIASPSIYAPAKLDFTADEVAFVNSQPAFVVHAISSGLVASHVQMVNDST